MTIKLIYTKVKEASIRYYLIINLIIFFIIYFSLIIGKPWLAIVGGTLMICHIIINCLNFIHDSLNYLYDEKIDLKKLIKGYLAGIFGFLILFTIFYIALSLLGVGYLTYGNCSDQFIAKSYNESNTVQSFSGIFYFSSMTFFTVGYGDICPMGLNRIVAILNAFIGQFFIVILVGIAIAYYTKKNYHNK